MYIPKIRGQQNPRLHPGNEIYGALFRAYDLMNRSLFDAKLPPALPSLRRNKRSKGQFHYRCLCDDKGHYIDEICLNPECFGAGLEEEILSNLAHEMVHLWQHHYGTPGRGNYHNREWAEKLKSIGLHPSSNGRDTGQETGDHMGQFIVALGPFEKVATELIDTGFKIDWRSCAEAVVEACEQTKPGTETTSKTTSGQRIKYSCSVCGWNIWSSAGAEGDCRKDHTPAPFIAQII